MMAPSPSRRLHAVSQHDHRLPASQTLLHLCRRVPGGRRHFDDEVPPTTLTLQYTFEEPNRSSKLGGGSAEELRRKRPKRGKSPGKGIRCRRISTKVMELATTEPLLIQSSVKCPGLRNGSPKIINFHESVIVK